MNNLFPPRTPPSGSGVIDRRGARAGELASRPLLHFSWQSDLQNTTNKKTRKLKKLKGHQVTHLLAQRISSSNPIRVTVSFGARRPVAGQPAGYPLSCYRHLCAMLPICDRTLHLKRADYIPSCNRGIRVLKAPVTPGGHLQKRRLQLRLLQSQVAQHFGVSMVTMSKWELDKSFPSAPFRPRIVEFLGYDPFQNPNSRS